MTNPGDRHPQSPLKLWDWDMNWNHEHDHHHGETAGRALRLATGLTLGYAGVEAGVGWWAGSLALVADASHSSISILWR